MQQNNSLLKAAVPAGVMKSVLLLENCTAEEQRKKYARESIFFSLCSIPRYVLLTASIF